MAIEPRVGQVWKYKEVLYRIVDVTESYWLIERLLDGNRFYNVGKGFHAGTSWHYVPSYQVEEDIKAWLAASSSSDSQGSSL